MRLGDAECRLTRTENPRVGGSIPPLATTKSRLLDQRLALQRIGCLSNIDAVQYSVRCSLDQHSLARANKHRVGVLLLVPSLLATSRTSVLHQRGIRRCETAYSGHPNSLEPIRRTPAIVKLTKPPSAMSSRRITPTLVCWGARMQNSTTTKIVKPTCPASRPRLAR